MVDFKEKMCHGAAKSLISWLDSLQSIQVDDKLSDELITAMSNLNLNEQKSLIDRAERYLAITLDAPALNKQLKELEDNRTEQELEDTYILNGAPLVLMRRLFGMHAAEFSRRRNILHLQGAWSGRPATCSEKIEKKIWLLWEQFSRVDERQRFITISEISGIDLNVIWATLKKHIDT